MNTQSSLDRTIASLLCDRFEDIGETGEQPCQWERKALRTWLKQHLKERRADYAQQGEIRIWCGTHNVNDKIPKSGEDIAGWMGEARGAELLVFAFQEFDLSTEAMFRYTTAREDAWRKSIEAALAGDAGPQYMQYIKLHSKQLVGALILIYAREDVRDRISDVSSASLATGIMGVMANKGATAIRLRYRDTPLTFVNSHLAAFVPNSTQRNAQYRDTTTQLVFPFTETSHRRDEWTSNLRPDAALAAEGWNVWESGALIWMGDLNYRLDLPREEVEPLIERADFDTLQLFDQLAAQQRDELAFEGFAEARIDFPPTFKFDAGTNTYDSSDKQRAPAYTDRVLYRATDDADIAVEQYTSHSDVMLSDHKPVSAVLRIITYTIDTAKRRQAASKAVETLDLDLSVEPGPANIELTPTTDVAFHNLEFGQPSQLQLDLINHGTEACPWSLVPKPDSDRSCPSWLSVSPSCGVLLANERHTLTFTARMPPHLAEQLSFPAGTSEKATASLSDLLILSVHGRDLFLSASATSRQPTILGARLAYLAALNKPIRETTLEERSVVVAASASSNSAEHKSTETVPSVLRRLVSFLAEHGPDTPDLFLTDRAEAHARRIIDCLDSGNAFPQYFSGDVYDSADKSVQSAKEESAEEKQHLIDAVDLLDKLETDLGAVSLEPDGDVLSDRSSIDSSTAPKVPVSLPPPRVESAVLCAAGAALLQILRHLPEPLVEERLYDAAIRCESREQAYDVLHSLNEVHGNTLLYLIAFVRVLLRQAREDRPYRHLRLAIAFSQVILRCPEISETGKRSIPDGLDPGSLPRRQKQFVAFLLEEEAPSQPSGQS